MTGLDREPFWSSEAQETFVEGCRVFAVADTVCALDGSEGAYVGRTRHGAMILWDTPDGSGYAESVGFEKIRNLYR